MGLEKPQILLQASTNLGEYVGDRRIAFVRRVRDRPSQARRQRADLAGEDAGVFASIADRSQL
jgi:hypothetical protein